MATAETPGEVGEKKRPTRRGKRGGRRTRRASAGVGAQSVPDRPAEEPASQASGPQTRDIDDQAGGDDQADGGGIPPTSEGIAAAGKPSPGSSPKKRTRRTTAKRIVTKKSRPVGARAARGKSRTASTVAPEKVVGDAKRLPPLGPGRQMLINAASGDECRIAVMFENRLEELFIERRSSVSHVGNIYKGIVVNVEQSIQAVFVDFGLPKHGFLHISDVQPQYFGKRNAAAEGVGKKVPRRDRPPIQKCFRRGQEVMVQITKEGVGTKGPTLTTYLSIPGRYLVMMPGMSRLGVSRKIEDDEERRRMREILEQLTLPKDMGFILRTAGLDRTKRDMQRDLTYLQRLWKMVVKRVKTTNAPAELYQESDLVTRTIRDVFTSDFDKIIVDTPDTADRVREFLRIAMPRTPDNVVDVYQSPHPIFHHYGVEDQIEAIHSRHVKLPSGGSIVIDSTEALVAIDVNSGKFRSVNDEEELAYQTNLEAAEEIARQLRLRDLGGLIICDFIDMRVDRHKRSIEHMLRDELKKHKERASILRLSKFGLIEMTRQRRGPSIKRGVYTDCPHCRGSGLVKNPESMTLHVLRAIQTVVYPDDVAKLTVTVSPDVAFELQNRKRAALYQLETETGKPIVIRSDLTYTWDQQDYKAEDARGRVTRVNVDAN